MRRAKQSILRFGLLQVLFGCILFCGSSSGDFMYKKYLVKYDRGRDVLCEPYVVRKNDWILKVFQQKGEIAYRDFSEFLKIFRRINPHVKNVNLIRPGQSVLIPLQKIDLDSLPGQSSGTVTIPFVTLSEPKEIDGIRPTEYVVRKGDCVSLLVSRVFGTYGTSSYKHGLRLFRDFNPSVVDLDRIYAGRKLILPVPGSETRNRHPALADAPNGPSSAGTAVAEDTLKTATRRAAAISPLQRVASALEAKLLDRGVYYFPQPTAAFDAKLDLSRTPVMVLKNNTRILFREENDSNPPDPDILKTHWDRLHIIELPKDAAADRILDMVMGVLKINDEGQTLRFSDQGVSVAVSGRWMIRTPVAGESENHRVCITPIDSLAQRTSPAIVRYLEQHGIIVKEILRGKGELPVPHAIRPQDRESNLYTLETEDRNVFVRDLMTALGYPYTPNVIITFPYAGIQVKALSNLISTDQGTPVFVDFGDLYGDAIDAIKKTGFNVVQIRPGDDPSTALSDLVDAIGGRRIENPTILAAERPVTYNTALTLTGLMVETRQKLKIFIPRQPLTAELVHFLSEKTIRVVQIAPEKG